jgi:hypothetical protein
MAHREAVQGRPIQRAVACLRLSVGLGCRGPQMGAALHTYHQHQMAHEAVRVGRYADTRKRSLSNERTTKDHHRLQP